MTVIYLDELRSEADVLAVVPDLEDVVIEAVTAERGKRQKISMAQVQVKQLMKKCGINRWDKAKKSIDRMFSALEREAGEYQVNMWSLQLYGHQCNASALNYYTPHTHTAVIYIYQLIPNSQRQDKDLS